MKRVDIEAIRFEFAANHDEGEIPLEPEKDIFLTDIYLGEVVTPEAICQAEKQADEDMKRLRLRDQIAALTLPQVDALSDEYWSVFEECRQRKVVSSLPMSSGHPVVGSAATSTARTTPLLEEDEWSSNFIFTLAELDYGLNGGNYSHWLKKPAGVISAEENVVWSSRIDDPADTEIQEPVDKRLPWPYDEYGSDEELTKKFQDDFLSALQRKVKGQVRRRNLIQKKQARNLIVSKKEVQETKSIREELGAVYRQYDELIDENRANRFRLSYNNQGEEIFVPRTEEEIQQKKEDLVNRREAALEKARIRELRAKRYSSGIGSATTAEGKACAEDDLRWHSKTVKARRPYNPNRRTGWNGKPANDPSRYSIWDW